jgi:hypothetical protein
MRRVSSIPRAIANLPPVGAFAFVIPSGSGMMRVHSGAVRSVGRAVGF